VGSQDTSKDSGGAYEDTTLAADPNTVPGLPREADAPLKRGVTVDRYVILERIGSGGMGVVYAAYDPNLDRKVALKLLTHDRSPARGGSAGHARTLREAQAMARLSHPNVVTVHDVGSSDRRVYIAMELVEGQTLTRWIEQERRSWSEILDVFEAAGRGLVAAHEVGLVHRDFKLDNVMVGDDGRIRVMDFGLARSAGDVPTIDKKLWSTEIASVDRLTVTGQIVGTPAYMAPELIEGGQADARADQFAFCVGLYRCLFGHRPFAGSSLAALYQRATTGQLQATRAASVPRWLVAVVRRGLAASPDDRYPTMELLLRALDRGRRRRGRVRAGVGVGLVAVVASAGSLVASARECTGGRARFDAVWSAESRAQVRASFAASGAVQADDAADRVVAALDEHRNEWTDAYREACTENQRGEASDEQLDRRVACLGRNLAEIEAMLGVMADADRSTVARAVLAVREIGDVAACASSEATVDDVHVPTEESKRADVARLRERLARATGIAKSGKYEDAFKEVSTMLPEVESLAFRPLVAEVEQAIGELHFDLSRPHEALEHLERACFEAEASQHDEIAAEAWIFRIQLEGVTLANMDAGRDAAERAEAAVLRTGDRPRLRIDLEQNVSNLMLHDGQHEEGLERLRRLLPMAERVAGEASLVAARTHLTIGNALFDLGRHSQARKSYQRALDIQTVLLGADHPEVGKTLQNLGAMAAMLGEPDEAREKLEAALSVYERALGPTHGQVGEVLFNLGWVAQKMDDPEGALDYFDRARAIELPRLGAGHPLVGQYEASIGIVLLDLERWSQAKEHLESAQSIFEKAHGPDHNFVARAHHDLGLTMKKLEQFEAAETHYRKALEIRRKALPADHPELGDTLENYVRLLVDTDQLDRALELIDELVRVRTAREADDPGEVVDALLLAGDVHRGLGETRSARHRYGEAAKRAESKDPEAFAKASARIEALDAADGG